MIASPVTTHGAPLGASHDQYVHGIDLLSPVPLRGATLRNRIAMAPVCQYSAEDGFACSRLQGAGGARCARYLLHQFLSSHGPRRRRYPYGAVRLITDAKEVEVVVTGGDVYLVLVGRELLREPYRALKAQHAFEEGPAWPVQYGYAVKRRTK
jgi:2,4-dienoyl-CoA reductase-like NADH-dependent reductase (Old Yellow Enzyme family)